MEHIVLSAGLRGDGALEVHGLADVRVVGRAISAGGILFNRLDVGRLGVLLLDGYSRIRGVQRAQRAQRGIDQIVAQIEVFERYSCGFSFLRTLIADAVIHSILLRQLGKLGDSGVIGGRFPRHIALSVDIEISTIGFYKGIPTLSGLIGISAGFRIIAFQIKDAINRVGLAHNGVVNGDRAAADCHGGNAQRKQKNKRKQNGHCLFHRLYLLKVLSLKSIGRRGAGRAGKISGFPSFRVCV